jgi:uncharacterized protein YukE
MPNHHPDTVALARSEAQRVLSMSPSFVRLSEAEQLAMYRQLVDSNLARMQSRPNGRIARGFADPPPPEPPGGLARSDIENKRFDQLPQIGADFIQQIDFPQFVKDLLQGVFDANLKVTIQQMKTYQDLLKTASKSIAQFAKDVKEHEAFGYLAETQSDLFSLGFDDEEGGEGGQRSIVLTDKEGNKLDLGDNEIKGKIMEATIALAKERRAMLRETILMGITRLVVEKGVVEASVLFEDRVQGEDWIRRGDDEGHRRLRRLVLLDLRQRRQHRTEAQVEDHGVVGQGRRRFETRGPDQGQREDPVQVGLLQARQLRIAVCRWT